MKDFLALELLTRVPKDWIIQYATVHLDQQGNPVSKINIFAKMTEAFPRATALYGRSERGLDFAKLVAFQEIWGRDALLVELTRVFYFELDLGLSQVLGLPETNDLPSNSEAVYQAEPSSAVTVPNQIESSADMSGDQGNMGSEHEAEPSACIPSQDLTSRHLERSSRSPSTDQYVGTQGKYFKSDFRAPAYGWIQTRPYAGLPYYCIAVQARNSWAKMVGYGRPILNAFRDLFPGYKFRACRGSSELHTYCPVTYVWVETLWPGHIDVPVVRDYGERIVALIEEYKATFVDDVLPGLDLFQWANAHYRSLGQVPRMPPR